MSVNRKVSLPICHTRVFFNAFLQPLLDRARLNHSYRLGQGVKCIDIVLVFGRAGPFPIAGSAQALTKYSPPVL